MWSAKSTCRTFCLSIKKYVMGSQGTSDLNSGKKNKKVAVVIEERDPAESVTSLYFLFLFELKLWCFFRKNFGCQIKIVYYVQNAMFLFIPSEGDSNVGFLKVLP